MEQRVPITLIQISYLLWSLSMNPVDGSTSVYTLMTQDVPQSAFTAIGPARAPMRLPSSLSAGLAECGQARKIKFQVFSVFNFRFIMQACNKLQDQGCNAFTLSDNGQECQPGWINPVEMSHGTAHVPGKVYSSDGKLGIFFFTLSHS